MAVRIPWNQSEAILLVDAYFMIENGTISRKLAVQLISEELRKKALLSKMKIDDVFRNTNGINMRFYEIQYIVSAYSHLLKPGTSPLPASSSLPAPCHKPFPRLRPSFAESF